MMEFIDIAVKVGSLAFSVLALVGSWYAAQQKALHRRLDDHTARISECERTIAAMPGRDDVTQLQVQLANIGGDIKALAASAKATNDNINRLQDTLNIHNEQIIKGSAK